MKINIIGHASLLVETKDCKIMMDPVLWDPHQEGLFDIFPQREIIYEQIPEFDLLIISHRHLDHFDIRTLAYLPKNVDVLIPKDKLMASCLHELGYSKIYPLKDFDEVKIGSTNLLATRSENRVPEYGIIFADNDGVCWNQVDTIVSPKTIAFVKSRYETIDLLLAMWQPMLEANYQYNQSLVFPYFVYGKVLENIASIQPNAIAPGSNGFKCINGSSWLNQIVFPITPERFCHDVKSICPEIGENVFAPKPGDIFILENGKCTHGQGECSFVNQLSDNPETIDFIPVKVGSQLIDPNEDNYDLEEMKEAINNELSLYFPQFLRENKDRLFREHCRWKVIYQLEIVFPDEVQRWNFDFSQENIEAKVGRNPLANLFSYLPASCFYGLLKEIKGWDYAGLGGYYRKFTKLYMPTSHGILQPEEEEITDPLLYRFPYEKIFNKP